MKVLFIPFFLLFFPSNVFSQLIDIYSIEDGSKIKNGITLKNISGGWTFVNAKGIQHRSYFKYLEPINNGVVHYCDSIGHYTGGDRVGSYCVGKENYIHIFQIMKDLGDIDNFSFRSNLKDILNGRFYVDVAGLHDYERKQVIDRTSIGYASKNGKFAIVNIIGDILTAFKYDNPNFNSYTEILKNHQEKKIYTVLDQLTGKEIFKSEDSIARFWNKDLYITKNLSNGNYTLTINSKKHIIPKHLVTIIQPPVNSNLFTYNGVDYSASPFKSYIGFADQNLKPIIIKNSPNTHLAPVTNFYNGRCLAVETIEDEIEIRPNGDQILIKRGSRIFKIIDENLQTVKILPEIKNYRIGEFNKYGNMIVSDDNCEFVIDYNGNHIIPPTTIDNRIKEVYAGLYRVSDYSGKYQENGKSIENFYDQKGKKLFSDKNIKDSEGHWHNQFNSYVFLESSDFNLIIHPNEPYRYSNFVFILDKDNHIIKSRL